MNRKIKRRMLAANVDLDIGLTVLKKSTLDSFTKKNKMGTFLRQPDIPIPAWRIWHAHHFVQKRSETLARR
ncbi:hypothetical protein OLZ29_03800, partial [Rhizobium sp. 1AS13]|uniref:hypothetical protein n=1 Tax=Rhizobium acaciae TaxID=2989736 RepID=UPI0022214066